MKNHILFMLIFSAMFTNILSAQNKKQPVLPIDAISYSNVYVQYGHKKPHNLNINTKNIVQLFGKPIKIYRAKSEISGEMYTDYTYPFGVISIEGRNDTDNIEFKDRGLAFAFKINNKFTKPVSVGDDAIYLGVIFPKSRKMMHTNVLVVWITGTDSSISFEINNGYIKAMTLFTNES